MKRSTVISSVVSVAVFLMFSASAQLLQAQSGTHQTGANKADAKGHAEEGNHKEHKHLLVFSKTELDKVPDGWTVAKTGRGEGSQWKVVADSSAPSKTGYVLAQVAKSPSRIFNLCVFDQCKHRDVKVEVCFKAVDGRVDQGGGIVWRYQDANNYYVARMNPLEDNYRLYKVVNGKRTQIATQEDLKVPVGQWHTLEIRCVGNKIECLLDGKVILTKEDSTFTEAGQAGLWTKADAQTRFDKFKVE